MTPQLTQLLLQFTLWIAVALAVGSACYYSTIYIYHRYPRPFALVTLTFMLCGIIPMILAGDFELEQWTSGLLFCLGSLAHGKLNSTKFAEGLAVLFCAVPFSVVIGLLIAISPIGGLWSYAAGVVRMNTGMTGSGFSAFLFGCSASSIPVFVYLFKDSQLRPGIDRHFKEGEETQEKNRVD